MYTGRISEEDSRRDLTTKCEDYDKRFNSTAEPIRHQNNEHPLCDNKQPAIVYTRNRSLNLEQNDIGFGHIKPPGNFELHSDLVAMLGVVQGLMPEIGSIIEQDPNDDPSDFDLPDAIEDITESLDSLFDLVPFIDELYLAIEEAGTGEEGQARVSTIEPADIPNPGAQFYKIDIRDKFPKVGEQLAETLAEVNWARHRRIREWADNHEIQGAQGRPKTTFTDSGLGTSNFTFQCPLPSSQKNPFSDCRSEASVTSFGTTNSTMSGGIRVPKPPVPLSTGVVFRCCICFSMLKGVDTNILWKYGPFTIMKHIAVMI